MTKKQLKKEAEEKGRKWERSILPEREEDYTPYAPYYPYSKGYIAGAEPREKRIAELEAQIEKMKCCGNCFYNCAYCRSKNCVECPCGTCLKHNHWEARR